MDSLANTWRRGLWAGVLGVVLAVGSAAMEAPARAAPPAAASQPGPAPGPGDTARLLAAIGTWDSRTASAELDGPYVNPLHQDVRFGRYSFWLYPWRSYMDTWPGGRFVECLGMAMHVRPEEADAAAQVLAEAHVRVGRVEIGWGSFRYDDPTKLSDPKHAAMVLGALGKHGIRPLILLNANSGWPCPIRTLRVNLLADADKGARELLLAGAVGWATSREAALPTAQRGAPRVAWAGQPTAWPAHPTGLRGQAYQVAFPLIVKATPVEAAGKDGAKVPAWRCELSAPLAKPVKAGPLDLCRLLYHPFGGAVFADGKPNPAAKETLDGWMTYVAAICSLAKQALGTEGAADAGFDLEVWNEYTFGSQFLDERNYYDPPRKFAEPVRYARHGRERTGHEIILPMTVDYVNDPASKLPGVRVISGLANQRPWENGTEMWPGQAGFSRHYYTGYDGERSLISPATPRGKQAEHECVNALGLATPRRDKTTVDRGGAFIPTHVLAMPEYWHYAYQTEFCTRDIQPFPGPWNTHHRYSHPGDGRYAEVWMTETNFWRWPWADELMKASGCKKDDPRLIALMHDAGAKALLRLFTFSSHKGLHTLTIHAVRDTDLGFGVLPEAFFRALKAEGGPPAAVRRGGDPYKLTDKVRAETGPQLAVLGRVAKLMTSGESIDVARALGVEGLVEHKPRLVFGGDGTAFSGQETAEKHPARYQRDDFAVLPFQLAADRYAVGYYVVTRNITHTWDTTRDLLDARRYDMPPQDFDLTLSNVRGTDAKVEVWEPLDNRTYPARTLAAEPTKLTVRLPATDAPRFLMIRESKPGPLIRKPRLENTAAGLTLRFETNVAASAQVTWGPFPQRAAAAPATAPAERQAIVTVPDRRHSVELPPLKRQDAVRVSCTHEGLSARWPAWDWDTAGVVGWCGVRPTDRGARVILDTDICEDCDDAGALAVLNALADLGEAEILAVMVNTSDRWGAPCVDAINTYYGRGDVPIGVAKQGPALASKYTRQVAEKCPHDLKSSDDAPEAVELYRKVLSAQPDKSVTIVSVGFLNNLQGLLRADAGLVARKVKLLAVMGGQYPRGKEYNFHKVPAAAQYVVANWPSPILFSGFEIGSAVKTGGRLARQTPPDSPVRLAYRAYLGRDGQDRQSWDQTAVLAAVRGPEAYWAVVSGGSNHVAADGSNQWQGGSDRGHRYLAWDKAPRTPAQVAEAIEDLMVRPPAPPGAPGGR